jgi:hypothetical protein
MATLKEQLAKAENDVKRFEGLLAGANDYAEANGLTEKTQAQTQYGDALRKAKSKVAELQGQISEKKKKKTTEESVASGDFTSLNLPFETDDKLINEIKNLGITITPESFNMGGAGAGMFVFQGEGTTTKPVPRTRRKITIKEPKVELVSTVLNSFWTDPLVQNKVMSALIASGNSNATQLDAYATWEATVKQAASLYDAGRGPKFTPMDILNMSIRKAGGPQVTTYVEVPRDADLKQIIKEGVFGLIRKEPDENDPIFQNLFQKIKNLYQKGETVTTTTDASGRQVQKRTPGVTNATIQAEIQKVYNQNNQDFLEAKSLEGADYFSQWQRG